VTVKVDKIEKIEYEHEFCICVCSTCHVYGMVYGMVLQSGDLKIQV